MQTTPNTSPSRLVAADATTGAVLRDATERERAAWKKAQETPSAWGYPPPTVRIGKVRVGMIARDSQGAA